MLGRVASLRADVEVIEVASAEHVWLPAWVFLPRTSDPSHPVLLALEPSGRTAGWRKEELSPTLASQGLLLVVPDLRSVGDLRPEFPRYSPQHAPSHQQEEAFAWASPMLGKPLLGQRVTDILAVAQALKNLPATRNRRLLVAARGQDPGHRLGAAHLGTRRQRRPPRGGGVGRGDARRARLTGAVRARPGMAFRPRVLS